MKRTGGIRLGLSGRKLRDLREYLTAYLMISPAVLLILVFGIFPVLFTVFVSVHKWRIVRGDYIGIDNYVKAIGNAAYVIMFLLGLMALAGVVIGLRRLIQALRKERPLAYGLALPGLIHSAVVIAFLRYVWLQLPEFLDIADKLRGQARTRELFRQLLHDAFTVPDVQSAWWLLIIVLVAALVIGIASVLLYRSTHNLNFQARFAALWLGLEAGAGMLWYTYIQIAAAYTEAIETGVDPGIWPQFITLTSGVLLLIAAWFVWRSASGEASNWHFWGRILAAIALLVGGWMLIGEIPTIIATGDKDLWSGLKVTVFFSLGTVPFQLALSMLLAILLFQKLRGSALFRMIFFIPYVTPFIASAAIFRQLFANRDTSPINLVIRKLGGEGLAWLQESMGVFAIVGQGIGVDVPHWLVGPSLALIVIIIHSIWTYVGYDTVIYLAGLANIPLELNEAAEIDGANKWDVFRHITFPLLSPTTYFLSLLAIIGTFKAFTALWAFRESLALGTTDTFSVAIFVEFFEKLQYGYASAMAFILFLIILTLTVINNQVQGTRVFYG